MKAYGEFFKIYWNLVRLNGIIGEYHWQGRHLRTQETTNVLLDFVHNTSLIL